MSYYNKVLLETITILGIIQPNKKIMNIYFEKRIYHIGTSKTIIITCTYIIPIIVI